MAYALLSPGKRFRPRLVMATAQCVHLNPRAAEFAAMGEKMFARLDDNGDGKIAKDEVPHHRKRLPEEQPAQ